jgi:uncharacterized membrane protein
MKKIITLLIVSTFIISCNNSKQEEIIKETNKETNTPIVNEETNTGNTIKTNEITEEEYNEKEDIIEEKNTETIEI